MSTPGCHEVTVSAPAEKGSGSFIYCAAGAARTEVEFMVVIGDGGCVTTSVARNRCQFRNIARKRPLTRNCQLSPKGREATSSFRIDLSPTVPIAAWPPLDGFAWGQPSLPIGLPGRGIGWFSIHLVAR